MKFLNHNLFTGDITVSGTTTLSTATGVTRAASDNSTHLATTAFVKAQGYSTTDSYVSSVSLNGNSLDFTGTNSAFTGSIDLSSISATPVKTVYETVKNVSGAIIYKGTPLAVVAGQTSGNVSDVIPADAADPAKMPAIFIANQNIADEAEGEAVLFGNLTGVDTSAYASGTTVYVAPGGGWTATKPVHPNLIQNLGVITKQHPTNGAGIVTGVGRANSLPNLTAGKLWVGSATYPIESTTVHVDEANGRVGIGTTSPLAKTHIKASSAGGNSAASGTLIVEQGSAPSIQLLSANSQTQTIKFADPESSQIGRISYSHPNDAMFFVTNNSEKVRITSDGNVGIGTTAPTDPLTIGGGQTGLSINSATTGDPYVRWRLDGTVYTDAYVDRGTGNFIMGPSVGAALVFKTNATEKVRITSAGNVGIGTTSPQTKLNIDIGSGGANGTAAFRIGGVSNYPSLELGIVGNYGGMVRSYGNDLHYYAGHWRTVGTAATEDHSHYWYTSKNGSTDWSTPKMELDHNGNLGIGTTSPGAKLDVTTSNWGVEAEAIRFGNLGATSHYNAIKTFTSVTGASNYLSFYVNNGSSGSSEVIRLRGDGNVGIGTTSPSAKLHLSGTGNQGTQAWFGNGFINVASYHYDFARVGFSVEDVDGGDTGAGFMFNTRNSSDTNWMHGYIYQPQDGGIAFGTGGAGTTQATEKLRITSGGNVGIGTTSPEDRLHIAGGHLLLNNGIELRSKDTGGSVRTIARVNSSTNDLEYGWSGAGAVKFMGGGAYTERMRIHTDGNVGIGTTSPGQKLHVVGEGKIQGNLMVGASGDVSGAAGQLHIKGPNAQVIVLEDTDNANLVVRLSAEETVGFKIEDTTHSNVLFFGDEDGNVGIGTTAPASPLHISSATNKTITLDYTAGAGNYTWASFRQSGTEQFRIWGSYSDGYLSFYNDQVSAHQLTLASSGNVGIGTTAPSENLHIVSSASDVLLESTSTGAASRYILKTSSREWRIGTHGDANDNLWFYDANAAAYRLSITTAGNVGIGTTTPQRTLDVKLANSTAIGASIAGQISVGNYQGLHFGYSEPANNLYRKSAIVFERTDLTSNNAQGKVHILNGPQAGSASATLADAKLTIAEDGNVGIGTTSPSFKLDVAGSARVTQTFYLNGQASGYNTGFNGSTIYSAASTFVSEADMYGTLVLQSRSDGVARPILFVNGAAPSEKMRIDVGGNVGIGTDSPVSHSPSRRTLVVADTVNGANVEIWGNSGGGKSILQSVSGNTYVGNLANGSGAGTTYITSGNGNTYTTFLANGNVGIGTTSPVAKLQITDGNALLYTLNSSNNITLQYAPGNIDGQVRGQIVFDTPGSEPSYVNGSDAYKWKIATVGSLGTGPAYYNSDLRFLRTTRLGVTDSAVMTLNGFTGNVGIGTTSPSYKLDISTTSGTSVFKTLDTTTAYKSFSIDYSSSFITQVNFGLLGRFEYDGNGGVLSIENRSTQAGTSMMRFVMGTTERMRITDTGNVGIGTTSPGGKLDVVPTSQNGINVARAGGYPSLYSSNDLVFETDGVFYFGVYTPRLFSVNGSFYVTTSGNVGIGTTGPVDKLHVANGNISITTGYSFGLSAGDTNWRIGRNIIAETGNYLTNSTMQFIAANAAGQGWQFINDDALTILEIDAYQTSGNVWLNVGNFGVCVGLPQEKIHVAGRIRIDGASTSTILETGNATAGTSGVVYATYDIATTYGVIVDYVIYDTNRDNMRTGTFSAVWNTGITNYNDISTVDIGDTSVVTLTSQINGTDVELIVTGDTQYTVKFNSKLIK